MLCLFVRSMVSFLFVISLNVNIEDIDKLDMDNFYNKNDLRKRFMAEKHLILGFIIFIIGIICLVMFRYYK